MKISYVIPKMQESADCHVLTGVYEQESLPPHILAAFPEEGKCLGALLQERKKIETGKRISFPQLANGGKTALHVVYLGEKNKQVYDRIRDVVGAAVRFLKTENAIKLVVNPEDFCFDPEELAQVTQNIVEGALLGNYQFPKHGRAEGTVMEELLLDSESTIVKEAAVRGEILANCSNLARTMVTQPGNHMTPHHMAQLAMDLTQYGQVSVEILSQKQVEDLGMGAFLAVAKGSRQESQFIVVRYQGTDKESPYMAYVGKGITFDSGGISLKPAAAMGDMKDDMAGAAAVMQAISAVAQLKLRVNLLGILPCTENMPSGQALKPGDVIFSMDKTAIEIISTDAEGRLVLADGISYALKENVVRVVDVATLTGACVQTLGHVATGVITNNEEFCKQVVAAGEQAGEKMWVFPSYPEYEEQIKSTVADLKNSGGKTAGMITAGLFLKHFVKEIPWVHMDIAGTVNAEEAKGWKNKGATGVAVRTLVHLAEKFAM